MANAISRRRILKSIVVVAGAGAAGSVLDACGGGEDLRDGSATYFPQSVASGDPKTDSVVLWTRVHDPAASGDLSLRLQVATDAAFDNVVSNQSGLSATAAHDGSIKVKVTGLNAGTTYSYRFIYQDARGRKWASRPGRTRTAHAAADDVTVRFAVLNCQDYIGRFWNSMQRLSQLDLDLDFVLAVGDYIYETTGNPSFQTPTSTRSITFFDQAGAETVGTGTSSFQAARSVENYRQLYRTYKSDPNLQALHEKYAVVATWDDHEYSDDCWGDVATYTDGVKDEKDTERRRNAEQAFFEFMPVDDGSGGGVIDTQRSSLYPNTKLWRSLTFGKNLELIVTDYRSFRPDHLIPEDGFPGTVVMDKPTLLAVLAAAGQSAMYDALPDALFAYVNIDDPQFAVQKSFLVAALSQGYALGGLGSSQDASAKAAAVVKGNLALVVVNAALGQAGVAPIPTTGKDKGLAWAQMGKQALFSRLGSRYLVVKPLFDLYAGFKYQQTAKASENALGNDQESFLRDRLQNSDRTFKVAVSSTSLTSMILDLRGQAGLPATLQQQFYLDCDQWDGFPSKRAELVAFLTQANVRNTMFVCGDIHAAFLSKLNAGAGNDLAVVTSPAISSETLKEELLSQVQSLGLGAVAAALVGNLEAVLQGSNPQIVFTKTDQHGFAVIEITAQGAKATFHQIPNTEVTHDYSATPGDLAGKFTTTAFNIAGGSITPA
jgi:alkaline phosphatase D